MDKVMLVLLLVVSFAVPGHAGENQDKRKAKYEARIKEQREREQRINQDRQRDFNAEDALYREIQAQERLLSDLRRKLAYLHEDNVRKYGSAPSYSQERSDYIHQNSDSYYR